jgi:hypothetical protein
VKVHVDADTVPFCDRENRIKLSGNIAIDACRIQAADKIGAVADRLIEQMGSAWVRNYAALRESDDLDLKEMSNLIPETQKGV